jgi:hypothetical protein
MRRETQSFAVNKTFIYSREQEILILKLIIKSNARGFHLKNGGIYGTRTRY